MKVQGLGFMNSELGNGKLWNTLLELVIKLKTDKMNWPSRTWANFICCVLK